MTPWRPWQRPGAAAGSAGCASKKRRANAISSADRSRRGCCRVVAPSGTPGAETTRALPSLSPLFSPIAPPASVYTMCGELPHGAARVPPQSWGDVGRKIPRGEGRTRVCYPHEWHQSVPHAHGVLRTAGWACPRDLRAVRAAHPSARGPRKGRARTPSSLSGTTPSQIKLYSSEKCRFHPSNKWPKRR